MAVREGFMQIGGWDLRLSPQTPMSVRRLFGMYDQIVITPSRVPGSDASRADAVANARYRGPLLEMSDDRTRLSGPGMLHYLTWPEGSATMAPGPGVVWDWTQYLDNMQTTFLMWSLSGLDRATVVDEPATTWPATTSDSSDDVPYNMFDALLFLAGVLGCEFYVTPDRVFHHGGANSNSLFTITTPNVILMRGQDGRDIDLIGLPLASWNVTYDAWDHLDEVYVVGPGGAALESSSELVPYDAEGDASDRQLTVESSTIDNNTDAEKVGQATLDEHRPRRVVDVAVDAYDIGRWIKPGDYLWCFDPVNGVYDTANAVFYHGVHPTPEKLRLYGMRWPIQNGMGVYLLAGDNAATPAVTDLTDYVVWESGATTLEVDAPRRAALLS